jgi:phenylacetate-CoA ligase
MDLNQEIFKYLIYFPIKKLSEIQLHKLRALVKYAKEYVPYHREKLKNLSERNIIRLEDIKLLPSTTKSQIKNYPEKFVSKEALKSLTKKTTGGSTGEPVTIWKTSEAMGRELAATWRGYSWAGINIGDRQARFWGVPSGHKDKQRARLTDFICNRKRCSAFSFDENNLNKYTKILTKFNPTYFYGYVSMLTEYAEYFKRKNIKFPINLKCVISTSEVLTQSHRKCMEEVFNTRVFNEYGSGELGSVAHECEKGSMHIMAENMIVEVLDGERVCNPGETGELVITELNNRAMPLIRYRTGDFASLSNEQCSCGKTLPIIENIAGRAYDMIQNKKGHLFHGEFFMYIFEEAKRKDLGIGAFQVIQMDLNRLKIKIKPSLGYGKKTKDLIRNRIKGSFDPEIKIEFVEVESISREASGKMRLIIGMKGIGEHSHNYPRN